MTKALEYHPDAQHESGGDTPDWGFELELQDCRNPDGTVDLWFHGDCFESEHAAAFIQGLLEAADRPDLVGFQAAHTCNRPLDDAFGGHACVVTKDAVHWANTTDFVAQFERARETGRRFYHYLAPVTLDGRATLVRQMLLVVRGDTDPVSHVAVALSADHVPADGIEGHLRELTPPEFRVMRRYIADVVEV